MTIYNLSKTFSITGYAFKAVLLLALFFLSASQSYSQPTPPRIRCISVESNGNVTLTWLAPVDTGAVFGGYHIYSGNTASGPFLPIDSIFTYTTLTTTITAVNANNTSLYFYIKTREGCCSNYSISSDTLRSIRMIVTPLSNETVRLNWNRTHTPPLPTTLSSFVLSKELTTGVFTTFRTLPDTTIITAINSSTTKSHRETFPVASRVHPLTEKFSEIQKDRLNLCSIRSASI
jgi:hypothetical protein